MNIAGARPNFMKVAPLHRAMVASGTIEPIFVHTGQHYDDNMSSVFLDHFGLPQPHYQLEVGSGSHAQQTARVMERLEPILERARPDVVVVFGDVNSTIAAGLAAVKLGIPLAHVEAGLRSYDRTMPEEINRLLTDTISDFLFAPSPDAVENLEREGIPKGRIFMIGNIMIDTLLAFKEEARKSSVLKELGTEAHDFVLVTLHRPSNVDDPESLLRSVETLELAASLRPVLLVAHPRTTARLRDSDLLGRLSDSGVRVLEPLGYFDFLNLMMNASAVLTDSGGIQEETTILGVPCVTIRENTERPITITQGTNRLAGTVPRRVFETLKESLDAPRTPTTPELWDGKTAERIVKVLEDALG